MTRIFNIIFAITLITGLPDISAQEVLTGLGDNPVVQKFYLNYPSFKKSVTAGTISIPFIDDFSDSQIIPKPSLWTDRDVFINNTYPAFPISAGVATFDAIDNKGSIYANASTSPFQADFLSSKPINLEFNPSDSIYLSFFYQPNGRGEMPENGDSLLLDFYSAGNGLWKNVWSVPGDSSIKNFKRVMIRIADPAYLQNGFRFRFRNYASLFLSNQSADMRANTDTWNIDYVKLDKNRSKNDTVLRDVTFIDPMQSLLKNYERIPWTHLEAAKNNEIRPFVQAVIMNHDSISRNIKTSLEIKDLNSGYKMKTPVTSNDLPSGDSVNFKFSFGYPFNFGAGDSGIFEVKAILGTDAFDNKLNDTLNYLQYFYDYYSLDDGSSEAGYGLRGDGTKNASVAVQFKSYLSDSLRAVDMYFNHTYDSLNLNYYFYLNVWSDNIGKPGNLLVNQIGMRPMYSDSLNKFVRYFLEQPVEINGIFYIGWQKTVDKLENIGFDKNRINNSKIFYTDNGVWKNSIFPGSIMIRPVLSKKKILTSEPEYRFNQAIFVYPNPVDKEFYISYLETHPLNEISVILYDLGGRKIRSFSQSENPMIIGDLDEGIYILKLMDLTLGYTASAKIIISH